MICSRCGEEVEENTGGWQMDSERRELYRHWGMCPSEIEEHWKQVHKAQWAAAMLDAGLVELEGAVEPVVQSL